MAGRLQIQDGFMAELIVDVTDDEEIPDAVVVSKEDLLVLLRRMLAKSNQGGECTSIPSTEDPHSLKIRVRIPV